MFTTLSGAKGENRLNCALLNCDRDSVKVSIARVFVIHEVNTLCSSGGAVIIIVNLLQQKSGILSRYLHLPFFFFFCSKPRSILAFPLDPTPGKGHV